MIPKMYKVPPTPPKKIGVYPPAAAKPGLVLATPKPIWPAPLQWPKVAVDDRAVRELKAQRIDVSDVVAGSIFGGPVTVGDPQVSTTITSAYTDKPVVAKPPMGEGDGWVDIFGQAHGKKVPGEFQPYKLRGAFDVPTGLSAIGAVLGAQTTLGVAKAAAEATKDEPKKSNTVYYVAAAAAVAAVGGYFLLRKK